MNLTVPFGPRPTTPATPDPGYALGRESLDGMPSRIGAGVVHRRERHLEAPPNGPMWMTESHRQVSKAVRGVPLPFDSDTMVAVEAGGSLRR